MPAPVVLQFIVDHAQRTSDKGLTHDLPATINQALALSGSTDKQPLAA